MLRKAKKANSNSSSSRSRENWDVRVGGKSRKAALPDDASGPETWLRAESQGKGPPTNSRGNL